MNHMKILLMIRDREYASSLRKALMLKDSLFFVEIGDRFIASKGENYNIHSIEKAAMENKFHIIIADEELIRKNDLSIQADACIIVGLIERPNFENEENCIYKFGGLKHICSEVKVIYAKNYDRKRICFSDNKAKLIGFTSGAGGVGITSIAISAARELSLKGGVNILYISFEKHESSPVYMDFDGGRLSINEYLYYLFRSENHSSPIDIDAFICTDLHGLSAFRPAEGKNELSELDFEQQLKFFNAVIKSLRFNFLFLDFPFYNSIFSDRLVKFCDKILLIDDCNPVSIWKNGKLMEGLSQDCKSMLENRIIYIANKWEPEKEAIIGDNKLCVEYDRESFEVIGKSKVKINLHKQFGLGIRRIADELAAET